jgi:phosphatidate cytidylyltransferase
MLRHRLPTGILLGAALILSAFYLPSVGWLVALLFLACKGQWECYDLMRSAGFPVFRVAGVVGGGLLLVATFVQLTVGIEACAAARDLDRLVLTGLVLAVFVRQFPQRDNRQPLETLGCTLFAVLYVPYLLNYLSRITMTWGTAGLLRPLTSPGRDLLIYFLFVVKMTDVGAYTFGRLFGRHKFFPRLSPKKTWEGVAGGVTTAVVTSCVCRVCLGGLTTMTWVDAIVLGVLLSCAGIAGDLFESLLKRAGGAKDSGALLPGMGGILDVMDSLIFGAPLLYFYVCAFMT